MKLESYWFFKEILLRFSYILVISRDYILSISSCPVNEVKARKLPTIANYTCHLFQNYFKGQKYGGFLLNCTKTLLIVLCWQSRLWVDFKIRICIASQEKEKFLCTAEMMKYWFLNVSLSCTSKFLPIY